MAGSVGHVQFKTFTLKKKITKPFLWMRFNFLKATLRGDSLLFNTRSLGLPGAHLVDLRRKMTGLTLEPPNGFEPRATEFGIQHLNH